MYNLFAKIDSRLTLGFIEEKLGYNLSEIDPQKTFFRPARKVDEIFRLVGFDYNKSRDDVERITSGIEQSDIKNATERNRCETFGRFCEELTTY